MPGKPKPELIALADANPYLEAYDRKVGMIFRAWRAEALAEEGAKAEVKGKEDERTV